MIYDDIPDDFITLELSQRLHFSAKISQFSQNDHFILDYNIILDKSNKDNDEIEMASASTSNLNKITVKKWLSDSDDNE
ncbi:3878_t:CDS:2, partial [Funneliformis mosseae]